jgi:hypothetical protein
MGTILVADQDGKESRESEMEDGVQRGSSQFPGHLIAWGLAVESVEAWTLGMPETIAEELAVEATLVRQLYPPGVRVESLSERSGKPYHRPKRLLERIAQLKHRGDCTEFRRAVAERTDVATLAQACPKGFAPFAEQVLQAFGHDS